MRRMRAKLRTVFKTSMANERAPAYRIQNNVHSFVMLCFLCFYDLPLPKPLNLKMLVFANFGYIVIKGGVFFWPAINMHFWPNFGLTHLHSRFKAPKYIPPANKTPPHCHEMLKVSWNVLFCAFDLQKNPCPFSWSWPVASAFGKQTLFKLLVRANAGKTCKNFLRILC